MTLRDRIIERLRRRVTEGPRSSREQGLMAASLFTALGLLLYGAVATERWLGWEGFGYPWTLLAGLPLMFGGFFVMSWAVWEFTAAGGTPVPVAPPPTLVTGGPYRHARNPMITGVAVGAAGIGCLCGSWLAAAGVPALVLLVMGLEIRWIEEPELARRLGEEYELYCETTPMFVPGWKGKRAE